MIHGEGQGENVMYSLCRRRDLPFAVLTVAAVGDNFLRTDQSKPVLETCATLLHTTATEQRHSPKAQLI